MNEAELIMRMARLYVDAVLEGLRKEAEDFWNRSVELEDSKQEEKYNYYCGVVDAAETVRFAMDEILDVTEVEH